jgi:Membrane carboxypeptidase (penicillin-binding protein)
MKKTNPFYKPLRAIVSKIPAKKKQTSPERDNFDDISSGAVSKVEKSADMQDISSNSKIPVGRVLKKLTKKDSKHKRSLLRRILVMGTKVFVSGLLVFIITMSIVLVSLTVYVMRNVDTSSDIDLKHIDYSNTSIIYSVNAEGVETELAKVSDGEKRIWVNIDEIPQHVKDAYIYTEDERFFQHEGVDWKRTFGAFLNMFMHFWDVDAGGSTITQQVVKNLTGDKDKRIERKIQEIFRSMSLEAQFSKNEILQTYLNIIHMGYNSGGVAAGARLYFNKNVSELTIAEAASLAGMTKNPASMNPIADPEKNKDRRDYTLRKMREFGAITQEQYDEAVATEVVVNKGTIFSGEGSGVNSWFVDACVNDVVEGLMNKKGMSRDEAEASVRKGGYRIYATVDLDLQNKLESRYLDNNIFYSNSKDLPQSAAVVLDYNGQMLACVGGRGEKTESRGFNRATQAERSPGSAMKPIAVYAPAIDYDYVNYSTFVEDKTIRVMSDDGKMINWPNNYGKAHFGTLTVAKALERSGNTFPVQILQNKLSIPRSLEFLKTKVGITTLDPEHDIGPSMCLGILRTGIKLNELAAAYEPFGGTGNFTPAHTYTKVINPVGDIVLEAPKTTVAMSPDSASVMNKMLQNVVEGPNGTAKKAKLSNTVVVGKTGTSDDNKDWNFVGLTPNFIMAVRLGYDQGRSIDGKVYGADQVWASVAKSLLAGQEKQTFPLSTNMLAREYCTGTGYLASGNCPKTVGYYKRSNIPRTCTAH